MMKKIIKVIKNPYKIFVKRAYQGKYDKMEDTEYLKKMYRGSMGKKLNLDDPKTFNEKLQWLKLYNRVPEYIVMVDKYKVREFVSKVIGEEFLIPLLGVWDSPEEIDFDALPEKFVLKCNHNSGLGMYICRDKSNLDVEKVKKDLQKGLDQDYFLTGREWPYKDVPRKIIAEQYMEDDETQELRDYKFFCFNGEPKALFVASDRQKDDEETRFDYFDMDYNHLPFVRGCPNAEVIPQKPKCFDEMRVLAQKLSQGIPHVRVDFYEANGKIYFGEMTFFAGSGFVPFYPDSWNYKFGEWLTLPKLESMKV